MSADIAIVVIGRNEGERLRTCLASLETAAVPVVYVDSGSRDGSPEVARSMGADVVELDPALPFTAGRGRNEGLRRALDRHPGLQLVQFVDGDCRLVPGWLAQGRAALDSRPTVAAVCGRVREIDRERSMYNRLCDMEWDAPPGESRSCGGNAMMRVSAFLDVGGFRPGFIAGEEPDLCLRLRTSGYRILRLADDMVWHDAAMTHLAQWWRRAVRAGWSYAAGLSAHGWSRERHNVREVASILAWGFVLPVISVLLVPVTWGASLVLLLLAYARLWLRVRRSGLERGFREPDARLLASFTVLAKPAQVLGVLEFAWRHVAGRSRGSMDWRGS